MLEGRLSVDFLLDAKRVAKRHLALHQRRLLRELTANLWRELPCELLLNVGLLNHALKAKLLVLLHTLLWLVAREFRAEL